MKYVMDAEFQLLIGKLRTSYPPHVHSHISILFQLLIGKLRTQQATRAGIFETTTFQLLIGKLRTKLGKQKMKEKGLVSTPHW